MFRTRRETSIAQLLKKMQGDWDERARTNARHFIANGKLDWTLEEFVESGRENVRADHLQFDFAFSFIVFQHIPSRAVIENYVREAHRLLRPGALFKFQVTDCPGKRRRKIPGSGPVTLKWRNCTI